MKTIYTLICSCLVLMSTASNQLKLRINGNGYADETAIVFDTNGSTAYNSNLDAWKMFSPKAAVGQLYTKCAPSESLDIYALPLSSLDTVIDLYALIGVAGTYLISPSEMSPFINGESILLEDKATGIMYDLRSGQTQSFNLPVLGPNSPSPFRIHFKSPYALATGIAKNADMGGLKINVADNKIIVSNPSGDEFTANISVYDMQGRELSSLSGIGQNQYTCSLDGIPAGMLIVRVGNADKMISKKLMKTTSL